MFVVCLGWMVKVQNGVLEKEKKYCHFHFDYIELAKLNSTMADYVFGNFFKLKIIIFPFNLKSRFDNSYIIHLYWIFESLLLQANVVLWIHSSYSRICPSFNFPMLFFPWSSPSSLVQSKFNMSSMESKEWRIRICRGVRGSVRHSRVRQIIRRMSFLTCFNTNQARQLSYILSAFTRTWLNWNGTNEER